MTPERLEDLLQLWGTVNGDWSGPIPEDRSLTGNSPLAAIGRANGYKGHAEGRSGKTRRLLMGLAAGLKAGNGRTLMVPAGYIDPAPCAATRTYRAPAYDRRETSDVGQIQAAWLVLYRTNPAQAELLRVQYQTKGTQYEKAQALHMPIRQYKEEIKLARVWMLGKLSR